MKTMSIARRTVFVLATALTLSVATVPAAVAITTTDSGRADLAAAADYCRDTGYWGYELSFPPPTVRQGMIDTTYPSAVMFAQCYLNQVLDPNKHARLDIDGNFGRLTRQAAITFQSDWCGDVPPVDGIVGPRTWAGLRSWATSQYFAC